MSLRACGKRGVEALGAAFGWTALALQFYVHLGETSRMGLAPAEGVLRYVSYFTVTTNSLVALVLTASALGRGQFLRAPGVKAATAVYIAVVMLVYEGVLRKLWTPVGLQWWLDVALHDVMPVFYVLYWLALAEKARLPWRAPVVWLGYPAVYCLWVMLRGAMSGFYPYPFLDAGNIGYGPSALNSAGVLAVFVIAGMIVVAVNNALVSRATLS
jgi:hypothetical protein